jgi:hypothetical protein
MLNQDYRDMLSALLESKAEFLIVGAYALAVHGYPRATADIDVFVKPSAENSQRVFRALAEFGAPLDDISASDLAVPGTILQIGVKPRRIDVITQIDGLSFDEAKVNSETITIDGLLVPVISKQNLITNKLATGRDKDRLDVENLRSSQ